MPHSRITGKYYFKARVWLLAASLLTSGLLFSLHDHVEEHVSGELCEFCLLKAGSEAPVSGGHQNDVQHYIHEVEPFRLQVSVGHRLSSDNLTRAPPVFS